MIFMKKAMSFLPILTLVITIQFLFTGCASYYKAISTPVETNAQKATTIDMLKNNGRVFILRDGKNAFLINEPVVSEAKNKMDCILDTVSDINKLHLTLGRKGKMKYKKVIPSDKAVLNEVHVYVDAGSNPALGSYSIPLESINKIEVIKKDEHKTTGSHLLGGIGIILGAGLAAIIIFIATYHPKE